MSRKLYTRSHDPSLVGQIDRAGGQFTATEHSWLTEQENAAHFRSYDSLMAWYMRSNFDKLAAVGFLIEWLRRNDSRTILSLGAGPGVLEHLVQHGLEPGVQIVATDFDTYMIGAAQRLLTNIRALPFDFFNDRLEDVEDALGLKFDTAVLLGSSYVLDDSQFVRMFADLSNRGMSTIIDFQAGFLSLRKSIGYLLPAQAVRRLLRREAASAEYIGKFHGYARTRREMRRLYRKAGLRIVTELVVGGYKYVAICSAD